MKKLIITLSLFVLFMSFFWFEVYSQDTSVHYKADLIKLSEQIERNWLYLKDSVRISPKEFISKHKKSLYLTDEDELIPLDTMIDELGIKHLKYRQYYKGIPVEGGTYILHSKNDQLKSANGIIIKNLSKSKNSLIDEQMALKVALNYINAKKYSWEDTLYEQQIRFDLKDSLATSFPKGELILAKKNHEPDFSRENYVFAYKFKVKTIEPLDYFNIFVDATKGKVLKKTTLIHHADCHTGTLETLYNGGGHNFTTAKDFWGDFFLRDKCDNIWTKQYDPFKNWAGHDNVWDDNNNWGFSTIKTRSTSAHWAAKETDNYFESSFSYGGFGSVRIATEWLGDTGWLEENGYDYIYLNSIEVSLDIVGHEWTHGLIYHSSNLEYENESGALNESFCDIFGTMVERFVEGDGNFDWLIGEDPYPTSPLRSMNDPSSISNPNLGNLGYPELYLGPNWYNGTLDRGGVHHNSSVQNFWFFLLAEGGNSNGVQVNGIGIERAARIAYQNVRYHLTEFSQYIDARNGSIAAARAWYGECSNEVAQVENAWAAVGVGNPAGVCIPPVSVNITGPTIMNQNDCSDWLATATGGTGQYTYEWSINLGNGWEEPYFLDGDEMFHCLEGNYMEIRVDVTSGPRQATDWYYVDCYDCSGYYMSVSPNPASSNLDIAITEKNENDLISGTGDEVVVTEEQTFLYKIFDHQGQPVYRTESKSRNLQIDVSNLKEGLYYLNVFTQDGVMKETILLNR